ncbi:5-hydroxytryptamine receptor 3A-like isoform X2 [Kryptolebias marmoratus]|uniref:5-hydroxytryptamine receptor 3A-like isoform X2 n=1 Tax=Kryptolebias marmoratus TaxID=37003 RepID=UPI000D53052E|nr:5-hydroxytryptamine receptor 3A-like isoform X2 [Kryptolebias marmoratus]
MAALRTLQFLALIAGVSSSQFSDCSYFGLLNHLNLTSSNSLLEIMRPVKNWTDPTLVKVDMVLYGILGLDEKSQTVTSHIWITKYWMNDFLTWNSSDFCGIDELFLPRSMLWIPDIIIKQDASDSGTIADDPWVTLHPSGLMVTFARQRLTFTCNFNLYKFPFDVQQCNITFLSMGADVRSLVLGSARNDSTLLKLSEQFMITQGEWNLIEIKIVCTNMTSVERNQSILVYMVTLERRPFLYVINFIIPMVYLLVLDLGAFFLSESGGDKLSFKVTLLLSISVLLLILKDILPSTEVCLPLIASLCVSVFTLVWLSVLETMLVNFLTHLDDVCGKNTESSTDADRVIKQEANLHKDEEYGHVKPEEAPRRDADLLRTILDEVKSAQQKTESQKKQKMKPGFCRKLAKIVDILFFLLYFLAVLMLMTYICMAWVEF